MIYICTSTLCSFLFFEHYCSIVISLHPKATLLVFIQHNPHYPALLRTTQHYPALPRTTLHLLLPSTSSYIAIRYNHLISPRLNTLIHASPHYWRTILFLYFSLFNFRSKLFPFVSLPKKFSNTSFPHFFSPLFVHQVSFPHIAVVTIGPL